MGEMTFDEFIDLSDKALFAVSCYENKLTLAKALKTANIGIQATIFRNMAPAAAQVLRDIMQYMVFPNEIEIVEAQKTICEFAQEWKHWNEPFDEEEDNDNNIF